MFLIETTERSDSSNSQFAIRNPNSPIPNFSFRLCGETTEHTGNEVFIMKKVGIMLGLLVIYMSVYGCATRQSAIVQQNLDDARVAIAQAKDVGATPATSVHLKEAEHHYRIAQQNLNQEPRGRFFSYLSQRKQFMQKASESAQLAKQKAELALLKAETVTVSQPRSEAAAMDVQAEDIQNKVRQLKEKNDMCRAELVKLREQSRLLAQKVEGQSFGTTLPAISSAVKEVVEIQFAVSDGKEQVTFVLNRDFIPHTFIIEGGKPRLVCDFFGARPGKNIPLQTNLDGDLVKRIRTWHHKDSPSKFRVVLDLADPFNHRIQPNITIAKHTYIVKIEPLSN